MDQVYYGFVDQESSTSTEPVLIWLFLHDFLFLMYLCLDLQLSSTAVMKSTRRDSSPLEQSAWFKAAGGMGHNNKADESTQSLTAALLV